MSDLQSFEFDAFLSYSTDPDYRLVRTTEVFLERFHKTLPASTPNVRELKICVDGSDFEMPQPSSVPSSDVEDPILSLITSNLSRSRYLVVFCSRNAARSPFVASEVNWFIQNRGPQNILLVVTEGGDPSETSDEVFPATILSAGIHRKPWYDFRAARYSHSWWKSRPRFFDDEKTSKLRELEDAQVQLACHLNGTTAGSVLPLWRRESARRRHLNRIRNGVALVVITLLLVSTASLYPEWIVNSAKERLKAFSIEVTERRAWWNRAFDIKLGVPREVLNIDQASPYFAELAAHGRIETVDLDFAKVRSPDTLRNLKAATVLKLSHHELPSLECLREFSALRYLGIDSSHTIDDSSLGALTGLKKLEDLDLSNCPQLTDACFEHLTSLNLKVLRVNDCKRVGNAAICRLAQMHLSELEIRNTSIVVNQETAESLKNLSSLHQLSVSQESILNLQSRELLQKRFGKGLKIPKSGGF